MRQRRHSSTATPDDAIMAPTSLKEQHIARSRIRKVRPRRVWSDEARDFTPWLAENIAELNMTLGISLKEEGTEVQVGTRYIDILAADTVSGRPVIIENQLENSDGDHLSRMLYYAASKDADTIIWIAREFTGTLDHAQVAEPTNRKSGRGDSASLEYRKLSARSAFPSGHRAG